MTFPFLVAQRLSLVSRSIKVLVRSLMYPLKIFVPLGDVESDQLDNPLVFFSLSYPSAHYFSGSTILSLILFSPERIDLQYPWLYLGPVVPAPAGAETTAGLPLSSVTSSRRYRPKRSLDCCTAR